jgi:hypothetical protein
MVSVMGVRLDAGKALMRTCAQRLVVARSHISATISRGAGQVAKLVKHVWLGLAIPPFTIDGERLTLTTDGEQNITIEKISLNKPVLWGMGSALDKNDFYTSKGVLVAYSLKVKLHVKRNIGLTVVLLLLGFAGQLQAQNTGGNKAKFIKPISLTITKQMNFGSIIPPTSGSGQVWVSHDPNAQRGTGPVNPTFPGSQGATPEPVDFLVTGEPSYSFTATNGGLTLDGNNFKLILTSTTNANDHMTMHFAGIYSETGGGTIPFAYNSGLPNPVLTLSAANANPSGQSTFSIGGYVDVAHGQHPGVYTGSWFETVAYN